MSKLIRGFILICVFSSFYACRSNGGIPVNATRDSSWKPSDMINKENKTWTRKGERAAKREMRRRMRRYRRTGLYSQETQGVNSVAIIP
jgi:hypothetical protein